VAESWQANFMANPFPSMKT